MLQTSNPIIKHKAGLLNLAEELGNVSKACKIMGFSRDTFYRYQELVQDYSGPRNPDTYLRYALSKE
jgi:ACT domain-containing protein